MQSGCSLADQVRAHCYIATTTVCPACLLPTTNKLLKAYKGPLGWVRILPTRSVKSAVPDEAAAVDELLPCCLKLDKRYTSAHYWPSKMKRLAMSATGRARQRRMWVGWLRDVCEAAGQTKCALPG